MPPPPAPNGPQKRKTLAEKGGEPIKRPATRPASSTYSRNTSLSSNSGSSHRNISSQSYRPQSAMDGSRTHATSQNTGRALTAFGMRSNGSRAGGVVGNPKGMPRISLCPNGNPRGHKEMVPHRSNGSYRSYASGGAIESSVPSSREDSLCNAMHNLSIDKISLQPTLAVVQAVPVSPSQIPRPVQTPTCQGVLTQTHFPQTEAPSPSRSPQKPPKALHRFLTRGSNTEAAGWDHDSRLDQFESNFADFKGEMSRITDERSSMNDMIAMYKTRSRSMHIQS